jgi:hypothetical protein
MRKARSILNGKDTPCLFLCVTHENLVCIVGHLFYRNAFGIIGIINSNMSISLCLKKRGILMFERRNMYPYFKGMVLKRQSIIEWIMHPKRYINLSHFLIMEIQK